MGIHGDNRVQTNTSRGIASDLRGPAKPVIPSTTEIQKPLISQFISPAAAMGKIPEASSSTPSSGPSSAAAPIIKTVSADKATEVEIADDIAEDATDQDPKETNKNTVAMDQKTKFFDIDNIA